MKQGRLSIADYYDLDVLLERDAGLSDSVLRARDSEIGRRAMTQLGRKRLSLKRLQVTLLQEWLKARRADDGLPGIRLARLLDLLQLLLLGLGLFLGAAVTRAVCWYDGSTPLNVVNVFGVLVVLQVLVLIGLIFQASLALVQRTRLLDPGTSSRTAAPRLLSRILRALLYWSGRQGGSDAVRSWIETLQQATQARRFARMVEHFRLLTLAQLLGVSFNVAALMTFSYLVVFTDLAFAWSTTLELSPHQFHQLVRWISVPWHFLGEPWVPSLEVIIETQYSRLGERYVAAVKGDRATSVLIVASWWRFLIASVLTYAFLPRFLLYIASAFRTRSLLINPPLAAPAIKAICERLLGSEGHWTSENTGRGPAIKPAARLLDRLSSPAEVISVLGLIWRDAPVSFENLQDFLERRGQFKVVGLLVSSGREGEAKKVIAALNEQCRGQADVGLCIVAESFEMPGAAFERLLEQIRSKVSRELPIYFVPITLAATGRVQQVSDPAVLEAWRQVVHDFNDRFLGLLT